MRLFNIKFLKITWTTIIIVSYFCYYPLCRHIPILYIIIEISNHTTNHFLFQYNLLSNIITLYVLLLLLVFTNFLSVYYSLSKSYIVFYSGASLLLPEKKSKQRQILIIASVGLNHIKWNW